jgi:protein gp37
MTVIGSNISWTNSTWNLWVGCDKVSAGCDNCYAEQLVNHSPRTFGHRFEDVKLRLERLAHVSKFQPKSTDRGLVPHLVFVNSMSDFWHDAVPDATLHQVLDLMEEKSHGRIYQILTKRPIRARKLLVQRYAGKGIPQHMWIGISVEDNRVKRRLDIMRTIKERCGGGVFFVSAEPIVEATDQLDFSGMDQIITGGESGPRARVMERAWLIDAIGETKKHDIPLWHKQSGTVASHPNIKTVPENVKRPAERMRWLQANGWELLPEEKGGATVDRQTYRELPAAYHEITSALNPQGML